MTKRYQLKRRAESQADTRQRIIEAAIALHERGDIGRVSVTAIAKQAGVSRLTVYRHFPDEISLFVACTATYDARHPLPDAAPLAAIDDPVQRLTIALTGLYAYYADNEPMFSSASDAMASNPALVAALEPWFAALGELGGIVSSGWGVDAGPGSMLAGAIGHAISFTTWRSLRREQGMSNPQAVTIMTSLVTSTRDAAAKHARVR